MKVRATATGFGISPGSGDGELHVDVDDALDAADAGRPIVLALATSSPADVVAMVRAAGIIDGSGDAASHAAVVARSAGVPAVGGIDGLEISDAGAHIGDVVVAVGTQVTVDGAAGVVSWEQL